jgi:hypothetical protein
MTAAERNALSSAARSMAGEVERGNAQDLQACTIPAVGADFTAIEGSPNNLTPLVQKATITIDSLYMLAASTEPAGLPQNRLLFWNTSCCFKLLQNFRQERMQWPFFAPPACISRRRSHTSCQKPLRIAGCFPAFHQADDRGRARWTLVLNLGKGIRAKEDELECLVLFPCRGIFA